MESNRYVFCGKKGEQYMLAIHNKSGKGVFQISEDDSKRIIESLKVGISAEGINIPKMAVLLTGEDPGNYYFDYNCRTSDSDENRENARKEHTEFWNDGSSEYKRVWWMGKSITGEGFPCVYDYFMQELG